VHRGLSRLVPEPEDPPEWLRRRATAYHEAGHATGAIAAGVAVDEIAILDRMRAGDTRRCRDGHVRLAGVDTLLPSRRIMVLVAGWEAASRRLPTVASAAAQSRLAGGAGHRPGCRARSVPG
jgi:endonuclease YncB( thermonuclease family)